jgi:hypothetical protein
VNWIHLAGDYEHGNEISGSINGGELIYQLSDCQPLMKGSAALSHLQSGLRTPPFRPEFRTLPMCQK